MKIVSFAQRIKAAAYRAGCFLMAHPRASRVGLGLAASMLSAAPALADWTTAANNLIGLSKLGGELVVWASFTIGLAAVAYGGYNLWRKGDERHGADIKVSHIFFPMLGGAVLMAISMIALMTVQTLGGSSSDIHNTTGF